MLSGAIVVLIFGFLLIEALPLLRRVGVRIITDPLWHPAEGLYGMAPMIVGTLAVALGALLLATPLGIASAIFERHYAPAWVVLPYHGLIELLAGIPSVVYGLWGLVVLVPAILRIHPPGASLLAGILVLALMILPTIALFTEAALRSVPEETLQGAAALGLSRWATLRHVALPTAAPGLASGVLLGCGRALGETMAVLMVCGNVVQAPTSLFDPIRTLTANIALEMAYATGDHRSALFISGLLLMTIVAALVLAAGQRRRGFPRG